MRQKNPPVGKPKDLCRSVHSRAVGKFFDDVLDGITDRPVSVCVGQRVEKSDVQPRSLRLRPAFGNQTSCETGGVGVFIVDPDLHAEFTCFIQRGLPESEPVVRKIRCRQSGTRMHVSLKDSLSRQVAQRGADLLFRQKIIPDPKRCRSVIHAGVGKFRAHFFQR